jgi:K+-sensing histidine kinase KdpD
MKNKLLRFPLTLAAIVFAVIVVAAALIGHVNVFKIPILVVSRFEQSEIGDVVTALVLVVVALVVDNMRAALREEREAKRKIEEREAERQAEQLRVVHVTMRTVQDIVNNCLNQIQLLRLDAEGHVPEESLSLFDEAIQETTTKLSELGNLEAFAEKQMAIGSGLDVRAPSRRV